MPVDGTKLSMTSCPKLSDMTGSAAENRLITRPACPTLLNDEHTQSKTCSVNACLDKSDSSEHKSKIQTASDGMKEDDTDPDSLSPTLAPRAHHRPHGIPLYKEAVDTGHDLETKPNRKHRCRHIRCKRKMKSCPSQVDGPRQCSGKYELYFGTGVRVRPHPEKVHKGGEDACFVQSRSLGVFDGVGSWAERGVDPGLYSKELSRLTEQYFRKKGSNTYNALRYAVRENNAVGSTTATVARIRENRLVGHYLGDSKFVVIRNGNIICQSGDSQESFNCPYQIGRFADGKQVGCLSDTKEIDLGIETGDIILVASDGLWDNVPMDEILKMTNDCIRLRANGVEGKFGRARCPQDTSAGGPKNMIYDGEYDGSMQLLAESCAKLAQMRGKDKGYKSPFEMKALQEGLVRKGGKLDDVTVVCAIVSKRPVK